MASQNTVFPGELESAEAHPSKVCHLYPKLDHAKQSRIGVTLDIEECKLAEFYLTEAQRLAHIGSWAWRVAGREKLHLSEEWYRIYGFDPRKGMPRWEERLQRVHPEDRDTWQGTIERAIRERSDYDIEFRILLPEGTIKWVQTVGHPIFSTDGELLQFTGISMDVTQRKAAEEKIREQEAELRQILDSAPQLIAVFGPSGERLYANRIGLDYIGLSLEEWQQTPGNGFSSPAFFHPDDRDRAARIYSDNARSCGSAFELELRLRKRDGTYRWFLVRFNPLRDEQGQITRWYVALTPQANPRASFEISQTLRKIATWIPLKLPIFHNLRLAL